MKKVSIFLIILVSLFFIQDVSALENKYLGTTFSSTGRFLSLNSYPSWTSQGYQIYNISGDDGTNVNTSSYVLPSSSFVYGDNGGALTQCEMSFLKGNYYSVTYYFGYSPNNGSNYPHYFYSSWDNKFNVCSNADCSPSHPIIDGSTGVDSVYVGGVFEYIGTFTVIFQSPQNGTCVNIAYSTLTNSISQNLPFLGYKYQDLGSKALTSADIQIALSQDFTDLENKIDAMTSEQQETNDKLDQTNEELGEMNDYIQDDTPASTEDVDLDSLGTVSGLLPAGPVDSLLNVPFTFLSVLTSSMGGVCVPITGTFVFDSTLSIPCFDSFYDEVPDYLMNFINLIPAGFILIMYFKHLYKKVERAVSLQTTADDEWGVI